MPAARCMPASVHLLSTEGAADARGRYPSRLVDFAAVVTASSREPDRWLFDEAGRPWHDNLVDYRWRSTRTDAVLTHKLHDLRHYFASGLIAAGCDVVTVQRAMGHASATTTLGTYAHLWPTAEDKTRAAASDMAAAVLATSLPHIEPQHASDLGE